MGTLERSNARMGSTSPLRIMFKQEAFEAYATAHPGSAHIGCMFFALVILACLGADFVALPKHMANRNLRQNGIEVLAIVDRAEVRSYKSGKSATDKYETTVHYHFTTQDGRRHEGASKIETLERLLVSNGTSIAVLYDPEHPSDSAWRKALGQTSGNLFVLLGITAVVSAWLGLFIFRYIRWQAGSDAMSKVKST